MFFSEPNAVVIVVFRLMVFIGVPVALFILENVHCTGIRGDGLFFIFMGYFFLVGPLHVLSKHLAEGSNKTAICLPLYMSEWIGDCIFIGWKVVLQLGKEREREPFPRTYRA